MQRKALRPLDMKKGPVPAFPKSISTETKTSHSYAVGDIGYWSPSQDLAVFYKQDGKSIPNPGIIIVGKIESGIAAFNVPGSVKVKIEFLQNK